MVNIKEKISPSGVGGLTSVLSLMYHYCIQMRGPPTVVSTVMLELFEAELNAASVVTC